MRIGYHWIRQNISTHDFRLSDLLTRIIEYKNNTNNSKCYKCIIHIKRNGNMIVHATMRNQLYFSQLPSELFSQPDVFWNTTPSTVSFHFRQDNESELREFLSILSHFDSSFSEITDDILILLTQFAHPDYHQDSARLTLFTDTVVNKSGARRQRPEEEPLRSNCAQ